MFVNCSNHPAETWSEDQRAAAQIYGEIVDYAFPNVPAEADEAMIAALGEKVSGEIAALHPAMVMCQGEFTLVYQIVSRLKDHGIPVAAACTERKVVLEQQKDGSVRKLSNFRFVRFRCY